MSCPRTVNTEIAFPNYCCLCCLQKHGSIQKKWGGSIVKKVSSQNKHYVYKCRGLTRHLRQSEECAAYYSSNGLSWNRDFNLKSSMLISGPTTHQQQHQPSSFGRVVTTGNAPVVSRRTIQEYFCEQSSTLESLSNNNNRHGTDPDNTTVHNDTNNANEFPMHFDTTDDRLHQTNFSSTHFNDLEKKRKSIPVQTPRPSLLTEIELMDILNQHQAL